jgi:ferredoxin
VHSEQFSAPPAGDPFRVKLAQSGIEVEVPSDLSMLEAIEAAGVDAPYLCRGGACGRCELEVLGADGPLMHNDHYLTDAEKAAGKKIMPCVSRAKCDVLEVNL